MKYVHRIQSIPHPHELYTGIADDFEERLQGHNSSDSKHTARHRPWKPVVVIRFEDDRKVHAFEQYLKSGLGHAFAERYFR